MPVDWNHIRRGLARIGGDILSVLQPGEWSTSCDPVQSRQQSSAESANDFWADLKSICWSVQTIAVVHIILFFAYEQHITPLYKKWFDITVSDEMLWMLFSIVLGYGFIFKYLQWGDFLRSLLKHLWLPLGIVYLFALSFLPRQRFSTYKHSQRRFKRP
jgi:hypothetical protein